jgi:predicted metal-dependent peptidase
MSPMESKMRKGRAALVLTQPFFGALALRLRLEECPTIKTADVDGTTLRFNPAYVDKLTIPQVTGLWAHEVMHCALGHVWRRNSRDHEQWNWACDYAVDPILVASQLDVPDATVNPAWKGWAADAIYGQLPKKPPQGGGGGSGPGQGGGRRKFGEMRDPPAKPGEAAPSPADMAQAEQEWKVATIQAANAAKAAGNLPGALADLVDQIKEPRLDWRQLLRRFVSARVNSDYRWSPPNRRYLHYGLYLPSLRSEGVGTVAWIEDTSGSVGMREAAAFRAERDAIVEDVHPQKVITIQCDAAVRHTAEYEAGETITDREFRGRGGTSFRPPFEWLAQQAVEPACAVYLTDLEGPFPDEAPPYPVLWVVTGKRRAAPFGEVVPLELVD